MVCLASSSPSFFFVLGVGVLQPISIDVDLTDHTVPSGTLRSHNRPTENFFKSLHEELPR